MLNNIETKFSIKDLENLSGIKAHTIRIWEKRYGILTPMRTDTNIRYYDIENLQKLLNVVLLSNSGSKISKIAKLTIEEIEHEVQQLEFSIDGDNAHLNSFKLAMLTFDQTLFDQTYNKLVSEISFRKIFIDLFVPLLHDVGLEWLSNNITPAHEHFISALIKQKLQINTERMQQVVPVHTDKVFVLFLPEHEIHELGLLFLNYDLTAKGYHSIYLGQSLPFQNLVPLLEYYPNIQFISYFTVSPNKEDVIDYINAFHHLLLQNSNNSFWITGRNIQDISTPLSTSNVRLFKNITNLIEEY